MQSKDSNNSSLTENKESLNSENKEAGSSLLKPREESVEEKDLLHDGQNIGFANQEKKDVSKKGQHILSTPSTSPRLTGVERMEGKYYIGENGKMLYQEGENLDLDPVIGKPYEGQLPKLPENKEPNKSICQNFGSFWVACAANSGSGLIYLTSLVTRPIAYSVNFLWNDVPSYIKNQSKAKTTVTQIAQDEDRQLEEQRQDKSEEKKQEDKSGEKKQQDKEEKKKFTQDASAFRSSSISATREITPEEIEEVEEIFGTPKTTGQKCQDLGVSCVRTLSIIPALIPTLASFFISYAGKMRSTPGSFVQIGEHMQRVAYSNMSVVNQTLEWATIVDCGIVTSNQTIASQTFGDCVPLSGIDVDYRQLLIIGLGISQLLAVTKYGIDRVLEHKKAKELLSSDKPTDALLERMAETSYHRKLKLKQHARLQQNGLEPMSPNVLAEESKHLSRQDRQNLTILKECRTAPAQFLEFSNIASHMLISASVVSAISTDQILHLAIIQVGGGIIMAKLFLRDNSPKIGQYTKEEFGELFYTHKKENLKKSAILKLDKIENIEKRDSLESKDKDKSKDIRLELESPEIDKNSGQTCCSALLGCCGSFGGFVCFVPISIAEAISKKHSAFKEWQAVHSGVDNESKILRAGAKIFGAPKTWGHVVSDLLINISQFGLMGASFLPAAGKFVERSYNKFAAQPYSYLQDSGIITKGVLTDQFILGSSNFLSCFYIDANKSLLGLSDVGSVYKEACHGYEGFNVDAMNLLYIGLGLGVFGGIALLGNKQLTYVQRAKNTLANLEEYKELDATFLYRLKQVLKKDKGILPWSKEKEHDLRPILHFDEELESKAFPVTPPTDIPSPSSAREVMKLSTSEEKSGARRKKQYEFAMQKCYQSKGRFFNPYATLGSAWNMAGGLLSINSKGGGQFDLGFFYHSTLLSTFRIISEMVETPHRKDEIEHIRTAVVLNVQELRDLWLNLESNNGKITIVSPDISSISLSTIDTIKEPVASDLNSDKEKHLETKSVVPSKSGVMENTLELTIDKQKLRQGLTNVYGDSSARYMDKFVGNASKSLVNMCLLTLYLPPVIDFAISTYNYDKPRATNPIENYSLLIGLCVGGVGGPVLAVLNYGRRQVKNQKFAKIDAENIAESIKEGKGVDLSKEMQNRFENILLKGGADVRDSRHLEKMFENLGQSSNPIDWIPEKPLDQYRPEARMMATASLYPNTFTNGYAAGISLIGFAGALNSVFTYGNPTQGGFFTSAGLALVLLDVAKDENLVLKRKSATDFGKISGKDFVVDKEVLEDFYELTERIQQAKESSFGKRVTMGKSVGEILTR